jgi:hypothetical protein
VENLRDFRGEQPAPGAWQKEARQLLLHFVKSKYRNDMDQLILYILIFAALVVIAGLVAFVVYYHRRLNILQSAMARCIEENIEMKDKLCELNVIYHPGRIKLTSEDFIRIMSNLSRRVVFLSPFLLLGGLPFLMPLTH